MGSKAEYEARKAAKRAAKAEGAARAAEDAMRESADESGFGRAEDAERFEDEVIRYPDTPDGEDAAFERAGVARITTYASMKPPSWRAAALMRLVFPDPYAPELWVGLCVVTRPGRVLAEFDANESDDAGGQDAETSRRTLRGSPSLRRGEAVFVALEREEKTGRRILSARRYPRILLPEDWERVWLPGLDEQWADEEGEYVGGEPGSFMHFA